MRPHTYKRSTVKDHDLRSCTLYYELFEGKDNAQRGKKVTVQERCLIKRHIFLILFVYFFMYQEIIFIINFELSY